MRKVVMEEPPVLDYSGQESINMICTNLSFSGKQMKRLLVTSCVAGEGKSTMTLRIAQNLGSRGKRVLLVDADLRRSHIISDRKVHVEGELLGLTHVLAGLCDVEDARYMVEGMDNVDLLPAGRSVVNPVQLLDTPLFGELMDRFSEEYDAVLVDTPPVGVVIDAAEIGKSCDGAILVLEYGKRRRRELQNAVDQFSLSGCPIIGCVIDRVNAKSISQKAYYKNRNHYGKYKSYYSDSGK